MPYAEKNGSTVFTSGKIRALGFSVRVRPYVDGAIDLGGEWVNLGATGGLESNIEETVNELQRNIDGVTRTYAKRTSERTKTYTFNTASTADDDVMSLFYGSAPTAGTGSNTDISALDDDGASTDCDVIIYRPSEDGDHIVRYFPKAAIRGVDEGEEETFTVYNFELTAYADTTWSPPTSIVSFGTDKKPDGLLYLVPAAKVTTVLDALTGTATP